MEETLQLFCFIHVNRHSPTGCRLDTSLLSTPQQGAEHRSARKVMAPVRWARKANFSLIIWNFRNKCLYLQQVNITTMVMTTQEMIQQIADYFQTQPVLKVWLFGSFSRGEEHENSDVDLLILPDKSQHFSLFTLSGMYEDLKNLLGRDIDLITDGGLMPFARESADRDKILIYERAA